MFVMSTISYSFWETRIRVFLFPLKSIGIPQIVVISSKGSVKYIMAFLGVASIRFGREISRPDVFPEEYSQTRLPFSSVRVNRSVTHVIVESISQIAPVTPRRAYANFITSRTRELNGWFNGIIKKCAAVVGRLQRRTN